MSPPAPAACRGFTLIECAIVCALAGVLVTLAWPSYRGHMLRVGRLDAVHALTRVQVAEEQRRAALGLYAGDLATLGGPGTISPQGLYRISLQSTGPDSYHVSAEALGAQAGDRDCATITLDVSQGFPQSGPSRSCWGR